MMRILLDARSNVAVRDWTIRPFAGLVAGLAFLLLLRLTLLNDYMAYSGDMASYLMTRNWVLGFDPTNHMPAHFRPPIVGAVLIPFTYAFGDLMGSKLLALLASVTAPLGFYWFSRIWLKPWVAVVAAWAFALNPMMADYTVGGMLPVAALGLMLAALRMFHDSLHRRLPLWMPAAAVCLLVGLNQTAPPIWALAALLMVIETPGARRRGLVIMGFSVAASLVWLHPFYTAGLLFDAEPMKYPNGHPLGIYMEYKFMVNALIGVALLWAAPASMRYRALPLLVFVATSLMTSNDVAVHNVVARTGQMVVVYGVIAGGVAVQFWSSKLRRLWPARLPVSALAIVSVAALALSSIAWSYMFHFYANRGNVLTSDRFAAVEWIGENTAQDAKVMGHPRGLAYYVGALSPRAWDAMWQKPLVGRDDEHYSFRCAVAWDSDCDPYRLRDAYGFDYILVDETAWQTIADTPDDAWQRAAAAPWLRLEYASGPVKVYAWQ